MYTYIPTYIHIHAHIRYKLYYNTSRSTLLSSLPVYSYSLNVKAVINHFIALWQTKNE